MIIRLGFIAHTTNDALCRVANMTRIIDELRRAVDEADHALDEVKREMLREISQPLLLSAESDAAYAEE